ncbi:MAG: Grx4 family monothiol glutaredoxin [Polyangia bacterium]
MALSEQTRAHIQQILDQHPIVLFMKGSKQQPRCGFSAQVVGILDGYGVDYRDIDVLSDPSLRDGIKEFGNWPTIPQLYFRGSLIGGCDIVRQLDENGELLPTLGIDPAAGAPQAPELQISAAALAAIRGASGEAEPGQHLRMELRSGGRSVDLYFDSPKPTDVRVERGGLTILFDRASARLASGLSIDYVDGPNGGFKIDNPNVPGRVRSLSVAELKKLLDQSTPLKLYDVRSDTERAVARIEGARLFDDAARAELSSLPKDTMLVFHCHHGRRSQAAAEFAVQQGFRNVWNLTGGIDAWSAQVDPRVPRY